MTANPKSGKRPPQQAVRVGRLERVLKNFNEEMGFKVALSLERYDKNYVAPLRERLGWLELPFYRRTWIRGARAWAWLRSGHAQGWLKAKMRRTPLPPVADAPAENAAVERPTT